MGKYSYKVHDKNAQSFEGVLEAPTEAQAQKFLVDQGYEVLSLTTMKQEFSLKALQDYFETPNAVQFNFFVRQMATLLKAGVPLLPGLATLQEGSKDPVLRRVLGDIYRDVEKGSSFSQAVSVHPRVFNKLFIATVRSGEAIGELDTVLLRLADILEKDYQTTMKIKAAMRYPIFAMATMLIAFLVATLFIIPRFRSLFESMGAELPLPTRILMSTSEFATNYWYVVLSGVLLAAIGIVIHYHSHHGRRFWDSLMLKMPVFGTFFKDTIFSRFARMLGMMLKSGVNILQGLELIADIVENSIVSDSIVNMKKAVTEGDALSNQMRHEGMYPILLVQIVKVGEESGKMDELLMQIAEFYDAEIEIMTKNMESMIEPFFIFVLAGFVIIMALGIFLPMWNMFAVIQKAAG